MLQQSLPICSSNHQHILLTASLLEISSYMMYTCYRIQPCTWMHMHAHACMCMHIPVAINNEVNFLIENVIMHPDKIGCLPTNNWNPYGYWLGSMGGTILPTKLSLWHPLYRWWQTPDFIMCMQSAVPISWSPQRIMRPQCWLHTLFMHVHNIDSHLTR